LQNKFIMLECVKNKSKIKFGFFKKKFVFEINKINILGVDGFNFKIISHDLKDIYKNNIKARIIKKILNIERDIKIIKLDESDYFIKTDFENIFQVAYGCYLSGFFIKSCLSKFEKLMPKKIIDCEIVILDGNKFLSELVINNICLDINFLSVLTKRPESYLELEKEIFAESGLNIRVLDYNKKFIKNADVIINTGLLENFEYAIKSHGIYIDLNNNKNYLRELKNKRPDVLCIDQANLNLYCEENLFDIKILEMILYCSCNEFKRLVNKKKCDKKLCQLVENNIFKREIKIASYQKFLN